MKPASHSHTLKTRVTETREGEMHNHRTARGIQREKMSRFSREATRDHRDRQPNQQISEVFRELLAKLRTNPGKSAATLGALGIALITLTN